MKVFLAALVFVGLAVLLLGVNIFFFHRPFPDGEISTNPEMRKRGIKCAKEEELEMLAARKGKTVCDGNYSDACASCGLYRKDAHPAVCTGKISMGKNPTYKGHVLSRMGHILLKIVYSVLVLLFLGVLVTSVSPIYDFREPRPFSGPDIFDPYRDLDTANCWKRANFHTHTRVKGPFPPNECELWPDETYAEYERFGYDIVTFSNHNEITCHPFDSTLQVNVYEQGYSPFKFHKLVFGSDRVVHFDPLLPLLVSQMQFELDRLGKRADFIQINHPYRTVSLSRSDLEALSGYRIMELDTGISTENEYWDWALSAGHYSFGLANDDFHHIDNSVNIAVRCNFLCTPSGRYEDLKKTLLGGGFYAMRLPDYGHGDWDVKYAKNRDLPTGMSNTRRTATFPS